MEKSLSKYNKMLTKDFLENHHEDQYFDRKRIKIQPRDIAKTIIAFANADGGTIVVGITDEGKFEGIKSKDRDYINRILNSHREWCIPIPKVVTEEVTIMNLNGEEDSILFIHIEPSYNRVIKRNDEYIYLRVGDRSNELKLEEIRAIEYDKGERAFEEEVVENATLDDLDRDVLDIFKENMGSTNLSDEEILESRGLLIKKGNERYLTYGAILLFAKYPTKFYTNARIRFIRYDGIKANVGTDLNIIKDINIEGPLHKVIEETKKTISGQLRDLNTLDSKTGKFVTIPEYPEFAWQEGIVNAVTHRDYSLKGSHIQIIMFDDRLEIISPGKLPNLVSLDKITSTRYSRNPRIARILSEFKWVKELGEGVKRIYKDMQMFFLDPPEFSEPDNSVKLTLKNNIAMRSIRRNESISNSIKESVWNILDDDDKQILQYISSKEKAKAPEISDYLNINIKKVRKKLSQLVEQDILEWHGNNKNDPTQYYKFK